MRTLPENLWGRWRRGDTWLSLQAEKPLTANEIAAPLYQVRFASNRIRAFQTRGADKSNLLRFVRWWLQHPKRGSVVDKYGGVRAFMRKQVMAALPCNAFDAHPSLHALLGTAWRAFGSRCARVLLRADSLTLECTRFGPIALFYSIHNL